MTQRIESLSNPKIKHLVRLLDSSKERRAEGRFVLEGLRLCLDCLNNSAIKAESVFFTDDAFERHNAELGNLPAETESFIISEAISKKIARTETPQGVFLLCQIPELSSETNPNGRYLALENIQNPDNFGSVCRCAEAMGLDGLIVSGGVDVFNPKALRASMGSALRLNITKTDKLTNMLDSLKAKGMKIFSAVVDASAMSIKDLEPEGGVVVVIGNEANGVSDEVKSISEGVTIPMNGRAESLNAAAAAAIIAWELVR